MVLRTHPRFAVTRVVLEGVPEARRAEAEELTDGWIGRPTLFVDLEGPVAELSKRSWVAAASARRVVPGTIAVVIVARPPVALAVREDRGGELWTVDRTGSFIGPYAGRALGRGDDFVLLVGIGDVEARARGAAFLDVLRTEDPDLLAPRLRGRRRARGLRRDGPRLLVPAPLRPRRRGARPRGSPSGGRTSRSSRSLERSALPTSDADLRFADRIVLKASGDAGRGKHLREPDAEDHAVPRQPRHRLDEGLRADRRVGRAGKIDIIGKGTAAHKGARKGAIIDVPATVDAIKRATEEAEIMAGVQIERAVVGVAGPAVEVVQQPAGRRGRGEEPRDLARGHPALARRGPVRPDPRPSSRSSTSSRASSSWTARTASRTRSAWSGAGWRPTSTS